MTTNKTYIETTDLAIFRNGRGLVLDDLAREQAIINNAHETDMTEQDVALINAASFRNRGERNYFVNQYRRHVRNIAVGNRFYQTA